MEPCGGEVDRPRGSRMTSLMLEDGVVLYRMLGRNFRFGTFAGMEGDTFCAKILLDSDAQINLRRVLSYVPL